MAASEYLKENKKTEVRASVLDAVREEQSFFVEKKKIVENGYDLSINKYKEVEYIPVEYPPTGEIMDKIMELDAEIAREMQELKKML